MWSNLSFFLRCKFHFRCKFYFYRAVLSQPIQIIIPPRQKVISIIGGVLIGKLSFIRNPTYNHNVTITFQLQISCKNPRDFSKSAFENSPKV